MGRIRGGEKRKWKGGRVKSGEKRSFKDWEKERMGKGKGW
jgi:hypothetical protein